MSSYYENTRIEVARFLPLNYTRVLEIGCGAGAFKENLNKQCEIWGVEPNQEAAEKASMKGYKVLFGVYDEVCSALPDRHFDLVICNDVIEHMANHSLFLYDIQKKMTLDGSLVGSVPNVRYLKNLYGLLIKKDWKYVESGVLDRTHLRFFTEKSLLDSLQSHGFLVEKINGINRNFRKPYNFSWFVRAVFMSILSLVTFGYYKDVQYMQFGFRVKIKK